MKITVSYIAIVPFVHFYFLQGSRKKSTKTEKQGCLEKEQGILRPARPATIRIP